MTRQSDWWVVVSSGEGPLCQAWPSWPQKGGQENKKGIMSECVCEECENGVKQDSETVGINWRFDSHWKRWIWSFIFFSIVFF